jgi:hypothetical protein
MCRVQVILEQTMYYINKDSLLIEGIHETIFLWDDTIDALWSLCYQVNGFKKFPTLHIRGLKLPS